MTLRASPLRSASVIIVFLPATAVYTDACCIQFCHRKHFVDLFTGRDASELYHADEYAQVHTANKRILEDREPACHSFAISGAL
jgi:hypothetical protein